MLTVSEVDAQKVSGLSCCSQLNNVPGAKGWPCIFQNNRYLYRNRGEDISNQIVTKRCHFFMSCAIDVFDFIHCLDKICYKGNLRKGRSVWARDGKVQSVKVGRLAAGMGGLCLYSGSRGRWRLVLNQLCCPSPLPLFRVVTPGHIWAFGCIFIPQINFSWSIFTVYTGAFWVIVIKLELENED